MKQMIFIMLALLVLCYCTGCSDQPQPENAITFYYTRNSIEFNSDSPIIIAVDRQINQPSNNYQQLLELYLNGPIDYESISPFPAGTTIEDFQLDSNKVQLTLSPHLATLSGTDLMIACACMTHTVSEMTGIDTVQIRVNGYLLNGQEILTLSNDSFALFDSTSPDDFLDLP